MKRKILTIGYSGFESTSFVQMLLQHEIAVLIDVREIPLSRKRGFSKTALRLTLESAGIEYRHYGALGSTRALRSTVRETQDYPAFFKGVRQRLAQPEGVIAMDEVVKVARFRRSCLMCVCPDWGHCHRRCVIEEFLSQSSMSVEHISLTMPAAQAGRAA